MKGTVLGIAIARVRVLVMAALLTVLAAETEAAARILTPHAVGWEHYFRVTWKTFEWRGRPYLRGYVLSAYGVTATRVQLLVDGLDASGHVVTQRVEWLGSTVPGFSHAYFEIPVPGPASSYRVRVFAFDFVQAAWSSGQRDLVERGVRERIEPGADIP